MAGPNIHLDSTVGCLFIGVLFSLIFFGCTVAQTFFYYTTYPKDPLHLKALVAFLSALDLLTLVLNAEYLRLLAITDHANPAGLTVLPGFWLAEFFLSSLTFLIVQLFFIRKIWTLLDGKRLQFPSTLVAVVLSVASFAGGVGSVAVAAKDPITTFVLSHVQAPASVQQIASVITDIYITVSLCIILHSTQASFERTQTLLNRLTIYVINRGILTATVQFLHFATYVATYHSDSLIWMIFHVPASKVYVNAVLATLNVRHKLREDSTRGTVNFVDSMEFTSRIASPAQGLNDSTSDRSKSQGDLVSSRVRGLRI